MSPYQNSSPSTEATTPHTHRRDQAPISHPIPTALPPHTSTKPHALNIGHLILRLVSCIITNHLPLRRVVAPCSYRIVTTKHLRTCLRQRLIIVHTVFPGATTYTIERFTWSVCVVERATVQRHSKYNF